MLLSCPQDEFEKISRSETDFTLPEDSFGNSFVMLILSICAYMYRLVLFNVSVTDLDGRKKSVTSLSSSPSPVHSPLVKTSLKRKRNN